MTCTVHTIRQHIKALGNKALSLEQLRMMWRIHYLVEQGVLDRKLVTILILGRL